MFKITPNPTFKAKVSIPLPGEADAKIEIEFRHFDREGIVEIEKNTSGKRKEEVIMMIACGWSGVDADFNSENVLTLIKNYHAAYDSIISAFWEELLQAKSKN